MGGVFLNKFGNSEDKLCQTHSFGVDLDLGGSVGGLGGLEMIARVVGRPWKASWGPKRQCKNKKIKKNVRRNPTI